MICATCFHDEREHVISVDRCNHPCGEDAHCICDHYEPMPERPTK